MKKGEPAEGGGSGLGGRGRWIAVRLRPAWDGLHSQFQATWGYIVRPCLSQQQKGKWEPGLAGIACDQEGAHPVGTEVSLLHQHSANSCVQCGPVALCSVMVLW